MKIKKLPILFCVLSLSLGVFVQGQNSENIYQSYFASQISKDFKGRNLNNFKVDVVNPSTSLSGTVIKTVQLYNNIPIYNTASTALIKDGKVVYYTDNFVKNYGIASAVTPGISKETALINISNDLTLDEVKTFQIADYFEKTEEKRKVAKQRLVYYNHNDDLVLAYEFALKQPKSPSFWIYIVDANSGNILEKSDLNLSCSFDHGAYGHVHDDIHNNGVAHESVMEIISPKENASKALLVPNPATYNVFKLPVEAPSFGARSLISNPWILTSSPEGWHSNGVTAYTYTRGNNVFAYEDSADMDMPGFYPDGGASRNFDFPYSSTGAATNNMSSSITNLFYMNNMMHDIFYKFGFTESARNFQNKNFGLGGLDDDDVYAEAMDGGGTNNANFSSPSDSYNGWMQMYLWTARNRYLFYNAPSSAVPRTPPSGYGVFGLALNTTGVTGNVAVSTVIDGCTALPAGSMANKIGMVQRGNCNFDLKVKNIQNAGGIGAIIYNQPGNAALGNMSGSDPTVTISSVLIDNQEGNYIINQINSGATVNVTLKNDPNLEYTPDGSFDNGIVGHEYGHGISNRLTGTGYNCLNSTTSKEQMGEGWSDFFALMITNKLGDNASIPRGIGTYVIGQGNDGGGIRPARYSPDFTINDFTYGDTNGMEYLSNGVYRPDVHSIGFIWATTLWDLHWNYVNKYGYASNVTSNTTNGSSRVLQLVMDALKLQPCNPTFIDGRNALLAADQATTNGADKCMIWKTFAKRGLGVNASAGLKNNINDQVQDFTVPSECATLGVQEVETKNNLSIYPNPAKNEFFINFPSTIMGNVGVKVFDTSGKLVLSADKISTNSKASISTQNLPNGVYIVKVDGLGVQAATKLIIRK